MLRLALLAGLLLTASSAVAQLPGSAFQVDLVPPDAIVPGGDGVLKLQVERLCSNPSQVLPQQEVQLRFNGPAWILVGGPLTLVFEQQVCATQGSQAVEGVYQVAVQRDAAPGDSSGVRVTVEPQYTGNPTTTQSPAVVADFLVRVATPPLAEAAAAESHIEQESPAPAGILLALGLVGLAAVLRRRA